MGSRAEVEVDRCSLLAADVSSFGVNVFSFRPNVFTFRPDVSSPVGVDDAFAPAASARRFGVDDAFAPAASARRFPGG